MKTRRYSLLVRPLVCSFYAFLADHCNLLNFRAEISGMTYASILPARIRLISSSAEGGAHSWRHASLNDLTSSSFRRAGVRIGQHPVAPGSLAFLLCVLLSSLSVLAYASPPDPSWVRGVYDDADFDDVVCLILANT